MSLSLPLTDLPANFLSKLALKITKRFRMLLFLILSGGLLSCSTEEPIATSASDVGNSDEVSPELNNDRGIQLRAVSTKPWLVTGGDLLVEVIIDESLSRAQLSMSLDGSDISDQFRETAATTLQALMTDIPEGDSTLLVEHRGAQLSESLNLTNYPSIGPIISGPHEQPYFCQTEQFVTVAGDTLGSALDSNCSIPTRVDYVYWSILDEVFKPLPLDAETLPPEDMGLITIMGQVIEPYIVRVETGTVNRAVYEIAMLHNPLNGSRFLNPWNLKKLLKNKNKRS